MRRVALASPCMVLFAALLAGVLGYLSAGAKQPSSRDGGVQTNRVLIRGVVQSVAADSITITGADGGRTLRLGSDVRIEALRPATLMSARPGDWVNTIAVPHSQTVFALTGLVIIPGTNLEAPGR